MSRTRARRAPAGRRWWRVFVVAVLLLLVFLLGVGLGRALEEGPARGDRTIVRTLDPLPLAPAEQTVTVTVTG
ncbi:MAG: hypothetical protein M3168_03510 [Actinomycetota bacterium]|nr:hypothetical protein [Actinomycetota bacterium]